MEKLKNLNIVCGEKITTEICVKYICEYIGSNTKDWKRISKKGRLEVIRIFENKTTGERVNVISTGNIITNIDKNVDKKENTIQCFTCLESLSEQPIIRIDDEDFYVNGKNINKNEVSLKVYMEDEPNVDEHDMFFVCPICNNEAQNIILNNKILDIRCFVESLIKNSNKYKFSNIIKNNFNPDMFFYELNYCNHSNQISFYTGYIKDDEIEYYGSTFIEKVFENFEKEHPELLCSMNSSEDHHTISLRGEYKDRHKIDIEYLLEEIRTILLTANLTER
jgi:Zn finger protein HypA/HybF involved in hydrogenase expression